MQRSPRMTKRRRSKTACSATRRSGRRARRGRSLRSPAAPSPVRPPTPRPRPSAGPAGRAPGAPTGRSRRPACPRHSPCPLASTLASGSPRAHRYIGQTKPRSGSRVSVQPVLGLVGLDLGPQLSGRVDRRRRPARAAPRRARRPRGGPRRPPPTPRRPAPPARVPSQTPRRRHSATSRSASVQIRASIRPAVGHLAVRRQVAAVGQQRADLVERARQRAGAAGHLVSQRVGVPLQPPPPLRPAGVLLPVRAGVAGVLAQLVWRSSISGVVAGRAALPPPRRRPCRSRPVALTCGGQVPALGRRPVVEVLGHPDPFEHARPGRGSRPR